MSVEFLGVPLSHVPDAVNAFTSDNPDAVQSVRHTCTELKRARTSHGAKPHLVVYVRNLSDRAAWGLVSIRVRDTEQHRITVPTLIGNGVMQGKLFVLPMGELTLSNEEGYPDVSIEWLQLFTK